MRKLKELILRWCNIQYRMAGSHRVPVPSSIVPHELVYGAMESFNHTEKKKTVSGIGGSHDTIVMLFQSIRDTKLCNGQLQISKKDISNELKGNIFT